MRVCVCVCMTCAMYLTRAHCHMRQLVADAARALREVTERPRALRRAGLWTAGDARFWIEQSGGASGAELPEELGAFVRGAAPAPARKERERVEAREAVVVERLWPNGVVLRVNATRPAVLVLSDAPYPGWTVSARLAASVHFVGPSVLVAPRVDHVRRTTHVSRFQARVNGVHSTVFSVNARLHRAVVVLSCLFFVLLVSLLLAFCRLSVVFLSFSFLCA